MKKLLVVLILAIGAISFSTKTQNVGKAKVEKFSKENIVQNSSFNTITLKLVGTRISIIGFLENNEGIRFKPFNFSFKVNKDEVKNIYFKDGTIYIWDN